MSITKQFFKTKPTCKVTFSLPKKAIINAKEVRLVGEFNNWNWEQGVPMKMKNGNYSAIIELEKNREYEFRYLADNERWQNDWEADAYQATPFGEDNSVVKT